MSNTAILDIFGLGDPLTSDGCGMRPRMPKLASLFTPAADIVFATYNGAGMDYAVEKTLDRLSGYDKIIVGGHSFGVDRAVWLLERYRGRVLFFFAFDGAPRPESGHNFPWPQADRDENARWAVPACVERWVSFTQRNDSLLVPETGIGVCGVPFKPDDRGYNVDCNAYGREKINLGLRHAGDRGVCMYDPLYDTIATELQVAANLRLNAAWANGPASV